jgi:hypothetical protein
VRLTLPVAVVAAVLVVAGCGQVEPSSGPSPSVAPVLLTRALAPLGPVPPLQVDEPGRTRLDLGEYGDADAVEAVATTARALDLLRRNPRLLHDRPKSAVDFATALDLFSADGRAELQPQIDAYLAPPRNGGMNLSEENGAVATRIANLFTLYAAPFVDAAGSGAIEHTLSPQLDRSGGLGPAALRDVDVREHRGSDGVVRLVVSADSDIVYRPVTASAPKDAHRRQRISFGYVRQDGRLLIDGWSFEPATLEVVDRS